MRLDSGIAPGVGGAAPAPVVPAVRDADTVLDEVLAAAAAADDLRRRRASLAERVDAAHVLFQLSDELVGLRRLAAS